ncbi:MAG: coproporphyrinogen III oxidase, partial [Pseudomonadota bacterium]
MNLVGNILASNLQPQEAPADPGFGIYVHWPFCMAKCPYCDFNSHVRHQP